jgi:hypothetical protein
MMKYEWPEEAHNYENTVLFDFTYTHDIVLSIR